MHQQWRLCLYLGLMASTVAATTDWPVFFEHLGLVHSVHNKWDLTLSMQLHVPKLEARILKTIHRLRLLSGKYEKETEAAFRSDQEKSRLEELQESWTKLNRQLSRRAETMRRRTRNLKNLGSSSNTQPKRKKRQTEGIDGVDAVLQLTGGVLQSLFSVAYTEDVKKVVARIDKIDDDLSQDIKVVRTSQSDLQTNTKQTLNKQDNTIHMMEKMAKKIERKVADMETNPYLKTEIGNIVRTRTELYQNLQLELDLMEERLGEIERVVLSLSNGRLDKNLLPPLKLRETLYNIDKQLPSNFTLLFKASDALWPYYSLLSATATFDAQMNSVAVRLSIPLIDYGSVLDLNRVHNLPLKAKDGYSVKVDITAEYLVTDPSRNHFLELNKEDFADCQVYHAGSERHFYCGLPPLLDATTSRSCVMQLYQGRSSSEWCQSKIIYGMVQPFSRLYNGSWVFSAVTENVQVTLQCPDGNIPTSLMGFGIVGLADGCTISNDEFWYPHTFAGAMQLNLNFGDKGWENADFHTDLLEGQEDFLDFSAEEYGDDLAAVVADLANQTPTLILATDTQATARSVDVTSTGTLTTSASSPPITSEPTTTAESTTIFQLPIALAQVADQDAPVVQALNVQDPENKATTIHNDILIKLREQFGSRWFIR